MNLTITDILGIDHVAAFNIDTITYKNFKGISTDSRLVQPGELFFAIRGEKLDGHSFVKNAFDSGAACSIVDQNFDRTTYLDQPIVVVKDTVVALGQLARIYRGKFDIPFIAIAGSNGKTTTKEIVSRVLKTQYKVLSTKYNYNNQIGVPLTLFRLRNSHEIAVIEIGTNHFGELKYLCDILQPTHGLITNIGREHLEFFINLDGVEQAEGELFQWLNNTGFGFVNIDDARIIKLAKKLKNKLTYGFSKPSATVRGKFIEFDKKCCAKFLVKIKNKKEFKIQLSVPGKQAMMNSLAAVAVGVEFGINKIKIKKAIETFKSIDKRMEVINIGKITILNDTYNANPDSMISALDTLSEMKCSGNKIIIMADMLELGESAEKEHKNIGEEISKRGFEYLLTYGELTKFTHDSANIKVKIHYDQKNILAEYAAELAAEGDIILVKGSRGMKMEDVVMFLIERLKAKLN